MKKKYFGIAIVILLFGLIYLFRYIFYRLEIYRNEKTLFNYFKLEPTNGMTEGSINDIEFYKSAIPQEYKITEIVDYYINQLKNNSNIYDNTLLKNKYILIIIHIIRSMQKILLNILTKKI